MKIKKLFLKLILPLRLFLLFLFGDEDPEEEMRAEQFAEWFSQHYAWEKKKE